MFCQATGGSVTSYIRSAIHNGELPGSVPHSPHLAGVGADVIYDDPRVPDLERDKVASPLGLYIVHEHDHDHL